MSLAQAIATLPVGLQHSIALYANPTMNPDLATDLFDKLRQGEETCDRIISWMPGATLDDGVLCYEWDENEEQATDVWRTYTSATLMFACIALRRRAYCVELEPGNSVNLGGVIIDDFELPRFVIFDADDCRFSPNRWGVPTWWQTDYVNGIID